LYRRIPLEFYEACLGTSTKMQKFAIHCLMAVTLMICIGSAPLLVEAATNCRTNATETICPDGVLLPAWKPLTGFSTAERVGRAIFYFVVLLYLFLGVSIIADRFMSAIEVITSQTREVKVPALKGEAPRTISVLIWNPTVSNLTLMALGSSAPEILLSIIEVIGKNFESGELGPGTIVGSAAYNLFIITAVCILVVPTGQTKRVKHLFVFFITAMWSLFAYLWLYLIIAAFTPNEITVWEAVLTFLFFPLTVITAFVADRKIFIHRFLPTKVSSRGNLGKLAHQEDVELKDGVHAKQLNELPADKIREFEQFEIHRQKFLEICRELRRQHPNISLEELETMAQVEVLKGRPKSRAVYRIQASNAILKGFPRSGDEEVECHLRKRKQNQKKDELISKIEEPAYHNVQKVYFDPGHYTVLENVGTFNVSVVRSGGLVDRTTVSVNYRTEDGTANANTDYRPAHGVLTFKPGEVRKTIPITVVDDEFFEEDEHFYIRLSDLQLIKSGSHVSMEAARLYLSNPCIATVLILDDDHGGVFQFEAKSTKVSESAGEARVRIARTTGARGKVRVHYTTVEGTAKGGGQDFIDAEGYVEFDDNQTEAFITVEIVDDNEYEKNEYFYLELNSISMAQATDEADESGTKDFAYHRKRWNVVGPPEDQVIDGRPRLGSVTKIEIQIVESTAFKNTIDYLMKEGKWAMVVGTSSWREQFQEALTFPKAEAADEPTDSALVAEVVFVKPERPSVLVYVMHILCFPWKFLFAFVPPTDYLGGWMCFTISIAMIGLLTAVIGDVASSFGCTVGLSDAVTAITFVAMGTSLPDTFASKVAAMNDEYADSSIGNITGSNAVNVFLGIGVAWTIATIYHALKGTTFKVEAGSLGFSVTIFCIFALSAVGLLVLRRRLTGAELGSSGNAVGKWASFVYLCALWVVYIVLCSLENYCYIAGF
jgi:solute carrier family 8 (sodium/calcium exchanger)